MAGRLSLEELRVALIEAETALEDVQLFHPSPEAIATARQRVLELRAALAAAPAPQPEPEPAPPPADDRPFAERLIDAWLHEDHRVLRRCLASVNEDSVDELRLAAAAWGPSRRRFIRRLRQLQPDRPRPPRPHPVLEVPPTPRRLVDLADGLIPAERALLLGLQALGALPDREPRSLRALQRRLQDELGEDPLLAELADAVEALSSGRVPLVSSSGTGEVSLSLTRLAVLLLPSGWTSPSQPLPVRVPYFLLRGRLGHCELELPFDGASTMLAAALHLQLPPIRRRLRNLVGHATLESPLGTVWLAPTLEIEVGRLERRARIVVQALPSPVSWSRALAHLQAEQARGALEGVSAVQLVTTPDRVTIVADLEHVVFSETSLYLLQESLSARLAIEQQALVNGTPTPITPERALEAFLEHRLTVERHANSPQLAHLEQRLELLEGKLVAEELGEALTRVLRRCDAVAVPGLARWALEHFASAHSHPELRDFERETSRWPAVLESARSRLAQRLIVDWRPVVPMSGGFSKRQAAALENGRPALQPDDGLVADLVGTWSELHGEHLAAEREAVRQRVRMDLDALLVSHFGRAR